MYRERDMYMYMMASLQMSGLEWAPANSRSRAKCEGFALRPLAPTAEGATLGDCHRRLPAKGLVRFWAPEASSATGGYRKANSASRGWCAFGDYYYYYYCPHCYYYCSYSYSYYLTGAPGGGRRVRRRHPPARPPTLHTLYVYIYIHIYMYMHVLHVLIIYLSLSIYIYMYTHRERERAVYVSSLSHSTWCS